MLTPRDYQLAQGANNRLVYRELWLMYNVTPGQIAAFFNIKTSSVVRAIKKANSDMGNHRISWDIILKSWDIAHIYGEALVRTLA